MENLDKWFLLFFGGPLAFEDQNEIINCSGTTFLSPSSLSRLDNEIQVGSTPSKWKRPLSVVVIGTLAVIGMMAILADKDNVEDLHLKGNKSVVEKGNSTSGHSTPKEAQQIIRKSATNDKRPDNKQDEEHEEKEEEQESSGDTIFDNSESPSEETHKIDYTAFTDIDLIFYELQKAQQNNPVYPELNSLHDYRAGCPSFDGWLQMAKLMKKESEGQQGNSKIRRRKFYKHPTYSTYSAESVGKLMNFQIGSESFRLWSMFGTEDSRFLPRLASFMVQFHLRRLGKPEEALQNTMKLLDRILLEGSISQSLTSGLLFLYKSNNSVIPNDAELYFANCGACSVFVEEQHSKKTTFERIVKPHIIVEEQHPESLTTKKSGKTYWDCKAKEGLMATRGLGGKPVKQELLKLYEKQSRESLITGSSEVKKIVVKKPMKNLILYHPPYKSPAKNPLKNQAGSITNAKILKPKEDHGCTAVVVCLNEELLGEGWAVQEEPTGKLKHFLENDFPARNFTLSKRRENGKLVLRCKPLKVGAENLVLLENQTAYVVETPKWSKFLEMVFLIEKSHPKEVEEPIKLYYRILDHFGRR